MKTITIEIVDREKNEVVETKVFKSERAFEKFEFYWCVQCNNEDFFYRIGEELTNA